MPADNIDSQQRRKRQHGAKYVSAVPRNHAAHRPSATLSPQRERSVLPKEMMEIVTDAGTFIFDDALSPSISYFLFRPDHDAVSETFEQCVLSGEPLDMATIEALHYIAELRLSDGWETLMADLFIDRDLVDDGEVQGIVESALVLLDDIEPGPEGTTLTVYWMQEIGVYAPETHEYRPPVAALLDRGEPELKNWEDYPALGFQAEHIPELIRMAVDTQLHWADDPVQVFAPVHAWRALGQLRAVEAIFPLLMLFDVMEELDDNFIDIELHVVFGMIGAPAIDPLVDYVGDIDGLHTMWARVSAVAALEEIGLQHPDTRSRAIDEVHQLLENQLLSSTREPVDEDDAMLNGFLINTLKELRAVEALPLIRMVFEAGIVDTLASGEMEMIEQEIATVMGS